MIANLMALSVRARWTVLALFLVIAGFPLAGLWAQVAVKVAATTCIVLILIGARRALLRQPMHAASGGRHA